ncbi:hypothetical protein Pyn_31670 [Prunus yedoensis var. nudiflora]|uniref:Uncharacterized protein n=1 Tax=Prunus yedoensis var. nudiflora TaxID=2094558 RepID=A0A314XQX8_PRUYE|nr:hypothetical protein Pyn_31670 [Prunus yedoensis var. nudiflora]
MMGSFLAGSTEAAGAYDEEKIHLVCSRLKPYGNLQFGADIVKKALSYPLKLIAKNAGVNGSIVSENDW